jgi:hypothetical protein
VVSAKSDEEPDELLIADLQVNATRVATAVDDRPSLDDCPVLKADSVGGDLHGVNLE